MEKKTYVDNNIEMRFNARVFKEMTDSFCKENSLIRKEIEHRIAEAVHVSAETVHKWCYGMNSPKDLDLIKELASFLHRDYRMLLYSVHGGNGMKQLTERQVVAVKKVYDVCIWFLTEFKRSDGFNDYWYKFVREGIENPEMDILELADGLKAKVDLVLDQEYFDLRNTEIYNELCEFACEDLVDIYDGKCGYAYRFEAIPDGNPTTSDDYCKAMNKLNEIIERYI